ncbi:MAG: DUF58 domain-containing protein [Tepidisphaeraceae bacterium]
MARRTRHHADAHATTVVRRKPSLDFSVTGLVYCSMMMFMGLAAMNSQANLLYGVFGLMIGILLVSGVISKIVLRRLSVRRMLPELAVVGQPTTVTYAFLNAKRFWPSLSVSVAELDGTEAFTRQTVSYLLHAAARMTAIVPIEIMPKRRGLHEMDRYQMSTSFPFGFVKRAVERSEKDQMLVYPALGEVDPKLIAMCRSADTTGAMIRPRKGGMDEFYGVKEHRSGENPRFIHWRRSARTGVLVAKEMTQVAPPRLLILVDTHLTDRSLESHVKVEKGIAMAASLASSALEQGLSVGLYAWSDGWVGVTPTRGKRHRRDLLAVLARLELNTKHDTHDLVEHAYGSIKSGTTPLLITPREVQVGMSEHQRSGMVVVNVGAPQAERWFRFPATTDFSRCMPADQQPMIGKHEIRSTKHETSTKLE